MNPRKNAKQKLTDHVLSEIMENNYLTNDIIDIRGGFNSVIRELKINGRIILELDQREFAVARLLAEYSLALGRSPDPAAAELTTFLPVKRMLAEIERMREAGQILFAQWRTPMETDVHRAVSRLRKNIAAAKGNPNLIETGPHLAGYRLSTPWKNISITVIRDDVDPGAGPSSILG